MEIEKKKEEWRVSKLIRVFCGSSQGKKASYQAELRAGQEQGKNAKLNQDFVEKNIDLVYGGGSIRLMGLVSQDVHAGGRYVLGVIPKSLMRKAKMACKVIPKITTQITGETVGEVRVASDMHKPKAKMGRRADAYIALLGLYETLNSFFDPLLATFGEASLWMSTDGAGFFHDIVDYPGKLKLNCRQVTAINQFLNLVVSKKYYVWSDFTVGSYVDRFEIFQFFVGGEIIDSLMDVWVCRLRSWIDSSKKRKKSLADVYIVRPFFMGMLMQQQCDERDAFNHFVQDVFSRQKKRILFPICWNGHWHLLVVDLQVKEVCHYNSLQKKVCVDSAVNIVLLLDWMWSGMEGSFELCVLPFRSCSPPHQKNGKDCGVFVYKYIQSFLGLCDMDKCIDPNEVGELQVMLTAELLLEAGKLKKRKVKPAKEPCQQSGDILSLIWNEVPVCAGPLSQVPPCTVSPNIC